MTVSSGVDSRTIIDMVGAEKLLGKGDMLFYPTGYPKPVRVQGAFLTDEEISDVVDFIKEQSGETVYDDKITSEIASTTIGGGSPSSASDSEYDDYFVDAGKFIIQKDKASIGMLQRMYKIGFNRAARIMDQLSDAGVVGPEEGTKPRKVIMSLEEFENFVENEM
jgi:S-DNA-T family DNA segregation ATPase FtsK/SpoIIIE